MKKFFAWMLIATMVATLSGCATVKKKFKRRKKQEITRPVVYTEKEFIKPYSNAYYYASHFNMWKVWQEELLKFLDGTAKKRKRAAAEVKNHLADMKSYLVEEKAVGLQSEIDKIERAIRQLKAAAPGSNVSRIRSALERGLRRIRATYEPRDMKEFIKSDEIEL